MMMAAGCEHGRNGDGVGGSGGSTEGRDEGSHPNRPPPHNCLLLQQTEVSPITSNKNCNAMPLQAWAQAWCESRHTPLHGRTCSMSTTMYGTPGHLASHQGGKTQRKSSQLNHNTVTESSTNTVRAMGRAARHPELSSGNSHPPPPASTVSQCCPHNWGVGMGGEGATCTRFPDIGM